jgi:acyl dehydratase
MPRKAETIEIGSELPVVKKTIIQRQIDCYSGVRPHSIHTDPDWARKKGFRTALAQALMSSAYVSQMMVQFLGEGFVKGGTITASFIKPVLEGDTLTAHAKVIEKAKEGEKVRVTLECWCENQEGVKTMVGTASGLAEDLRPGAAG